MPLPIPWPLYLKSRKQNHLKPNPIPQAQAFAIFYLLTWGYVPSYFLHLSSNSAMKILQWQHPSHYSNDLTISVCPALLEERAGFLFLFFFFSRNLQHPAQGHPKCVLIHIEQRTVQINMRYVSERRQKIWKRWWDLPYIVIFLHNLKVKPGKITLEWYFLKWNVLIFYHILY